MIRKDLYNIRFAIVSVLIYCLFMQIIFGTVCPFKALTGIDCPGCGLTHATIYFLTGKVKLAFNCNPTFVLWWMCIILFCFDRYVYKLKIKVFPVMFSVVGVITIFWYFIKIFV